MDIVTYALSKKLVNGIQSGLASATVDNTNCSITFNWTNGTSSTMTFPKPADGAKGDKGDTGASVQGVEIQEISGIRHLIVTLNDGTEIDAGILPNEQYDDTVIKADIVDLQADITTVKNDLVTAKTDIDTLGVDVDTLEGKEIDTITYSNSELTITSKDTTTKTVTIKPNLVDLADVDITSPNSGDVVTYSASTGKFTTGHVSSTDQYVKMTATDSNAGYLADLIDDDTIKNNNGKLEVEKIKGQNITVDELNTLLGMDTNVKDSLNALASGGMVFKDVVQTYADLPTGALNGFVYIVNTDETDDNNRNAYIYSDVHNGYVLVGTSGLEVRDFTTNPIDLENEVIGVLPKDKMQTTDLVDKTKDVIDTLSYPIPNEDLEKIPNLKVLKQINTEVINALNGKMNNTDIVDNLTDNSVDKPLSANQGNVLDGKIEHKIDKSNIVTTLDDTVTNEQIPSAKVVYDELDKKLGAEDITTTLDETSTDTQVPSAKAVETRISKREIIKNVDLNTFVDEGKYYIASGCTNSPIDGGYLNIMRYNDDFVCQICARYHISTSKNMYIRTKVSGVWEEWQRVCTTSVADVGKTDFTISSSNYTISDSVCEYCVVNGVCYVRMYIYCKSPSSTGDRHSVPIPKSKRGIEYFHGKVWNTENDSRINAILTTDGYISISGGKAGCYYLVTESYPVAES